MRPDTQVVLQKLSEVLSLLAPVAPEPLTTAQRRALGGHLFLEARRVVLAVAEGLVRHPELFPDVTTDGAGLRDRQAHADAWRRLHGALTHFAELANDAYLRAQGEAAAEAVAVVRHVEQTAALAFAVGLPDGEERLGALCEARAILGRRQARLRRGRARGRRGEEVSA